MSINKISQSKAILLVEDNPDDVLITRRALDKGRIFNPLYIVNDGESALRFMRREGEFRNSCTPALVLLDLNMPKKDGFQVLKEMKSDQMLKSIPVVVLTTSDRDNDVERAYLLGCNSFIVKPVSFESFLKVLISIKEYWLSISRVPS
jgi:chemotaxis family two-component system response regulator Rcp1